MLTLILAMAIGGCARDPMAGEPCVGIGEVAGSDGTVLERHEHRVASQWDEHTHWPVGDRSLAVTVFSQRDPRGDLVHQRSTVRSQRHAESWFRGADGRVLEQTVVWPDGVVARHVHVYDGDLLSRIETWLDHDDTPLQVNEHRYDADGRLVEQRILESEGPPEVRTRTYDHPAPSLDGRITADLDGDGSPELWSDVRYDDAGRLTSLESTHLFRGVLRVTTREISYDEAGNEAYTIEAFESDGEPVILERTTTRDPEGRLLDVRTWVTTDDGGPTLTFHSTWDWTCPERGR